MQLTETIRWKDVPTQFIDPRHVDIWLPPEYHTQPERRFPVLYMHNGQNLFYPEESFSGVGWGIVPAMQKALEHGIIRPAIIVGIWNTNVMGSSMGGLMSLYAICEYTHIFGGAGCLSTHWPILKQTMINYLK